jgi:hypothetical protein
LTAWIGLKSGLGFDEAVVTELRWKLVRRVEEWIDHDDAIKVLSSLKVFGEEPAAGGGFGGCHDQSIPEREVIAVLNFPGMIEQQRID